MPKHYGNVCVTYFVNKAIAAQHNPITRAHKVTKHVDHYRAVGAAIDILLVLLRAA